MTVGNPEAVRPAEPVGELELVHAFTGPMPTGVSVSHSGRVFVNFPEWGDHPPATVVEIRDGEEQPYPDQAWNSATGVDDEAAFVSAQSIVVDPADRLWVLDTGSPMFAPTQVGGPKLVGIDLETDRVVQTIVIPRDVALETTYLNLETDDAGRIYLTAGEQNAVLRRLPDGTFETVVHDPRLLWPDTLSVAQDGHLYVTANQLHRQPDYQGGEDRRVKPYALFRTPIDAGPVRLRPATSG
jgi:sugar lactone lactonase YvrE